MTAVENIQTSVDGLLANDYTADIDAIQTGLEQAQTSIASLTSALENFDGNDAELATISASLAVMSDDVKE